MADTHKRNVWSEDPNISNAVRRSIAAIKSWLPILTDLRAFIESRALVFMPYYLTPSFPYDAAAPKLAEARKRLRLRADTHPEPHRAPTFEDGDWSRPPKIEATDDSEAKEVLAEDEALTAWLNARMLGLDPVFPNRRMFDWASRLYFQDGDRPSDIMTDMLTIDVLPFGDQNPIDIETLWKIRRNESVFHEVRLASAACKKMLSENLKESAPPEVATLLCRQFLDDQLLSHTKGEAVLRKLEKPAPSLGLSLAVSVGVSLLTANPFIGIAVGTALNPSLAHLAKQKLSSMDRAVGLLQALL
jgi:hypothetical protein